MILGAKCVFQCECGLLHTKYDNQTKTIYLQLIPRSLESTVLFLRGLHSFYHNLGRIYRYFAQLGTEIYLI